MASFNIVCPANRTFSLWSHTIQDCLKNLGHKALIQNQVNASKADVELIHAPNKFKKFIRKPGVKYVAIQGEQLPLKHCKNKWLTDKWVIMQKYIHQYDVIWDTFAPMHDHLYRKPSVYYQMGYHELFDYTSMDIKPMYYLSFLGALNDRRMNILDNVRPRVNIHWEFLDGDARAEFILQSKAHLSVQYVDTGLLPTLRALFVMCSKRLLISENFLLEDDLKPFIPQVEGDLGKAFSETFIEYMCDDKYDEVVENAYEYLRLERTMLRSIRGMVDGL